MVKKQNKQSNMEQIAAGARAHGWHLLSERKPKRETWVYVYAIREAGKFGTIDHTFVCLYDENAEFFQLHRDGWVNHIVAWRSLEADAKEARAFALAAGIGIQTKGA